MGVPVSPASDDQRYAGLFTFAQLAPVCLALLDDKRWVGRRCERVSFVSGDVIERRVRTDVTLPDSAPFDDKPGVYVLPLFALPKRAPSWGFELSDDHGHRMAWPSRDELAELGAALLVWRAFRVISGGPVPADVEHTLRRVAISPDPDEAQRLLKAALEPSPSLAQAWLQLASSVAFRGLAQRIAASWIAVAVLSSLSRVPQVVELAYRQRLTLERSGGISSLVGVLGWRDHQVRLELTQPLAPDQRIELTAQAGVELRDVHVFRGTDEASPTVTYVAASTAEASLEVPGDAEGRAAVVAARLRPASAVVRRVTTTAAIATAAIAAAALWSGRIQASHSTAPALVLLAAASAVLSLVLRTGQDGLLERLVAPTRMLLLVIGGATAVAAARVAVIAESGKGATGLRLFLLVAAAVSVAALVLLVLTRPQRLGPTTLATARQSEPLEQSEQGQMPSVSSAVPPSSPPDNRPADG